METFTIFSCEASEVVFDLLMFDYFYGFLLNTYTAFRREKQLTKDQCSNMLLFLFSNQLGLLAMK